MICGNITAPFVVIVVQLIPREATAVAPAARMQIHSVSLMRLHLMSRGNLHADLALQNTKHRTIAHDISGGLERKQHFAARSWIGPRSLLLKVNKARYPLSSFIKPSLYGTWNFLVGDRRRATRRQLPMKWRARIFLPLRSIRRLWRMRRVSQMTLTATR